MKHQTGGLGDRVVAYLTFMPGCRRSGGSIPGGEKEICLCIGLFSLFLHLKLCRVILLTVLGSVNY